MRKYIFLAAGMLIISAIYSQRMTVVENFDGSTVSFSSTPTNAWSKDNIYSTSYPSSYRGRVPHATGDSVILTTPVYNFTGNSHVLLRFKHICKISPLDRVSIEYRIGGQGWTPIPVSAYQGKASNYNSTGFNAASYIAWMANDSTAIPSLFWWEEENFDLGFEVGNENVVQFRFVLKHGSAPGTQVSYGWLLDDVEVIAAVDEIKSPVVEFLPPVKDTVYSTGPWEINAKVKTSTNARIQTPWLKYTAAQSGTVIKTDSILMTMVSGDSLWKASIPQFVIGTDVQYSITGKDTVGNYKTVVSGYIIAIGVEDILILQGNGTNIGNYPFQHTYGYSRSMALYPAAEMSKKVEGQISAIALRVATVGSGAFPMKIWLKTVPASKTTWDVSDNLDWSVLTQDATLVYEGNFHFPTTGWIDIPLDKTFSYNGKDNLVIMFEQNCTATNCATWMSIYSQYYYSTSQTNRLWYKYSNTSPPTVTTALYRYAYRPDLRVDIKGATGSIAAAIHSIDINDTIVVSPSSNIPIVATIKNKGSLDLDSVKVSYSINGSIPVHKNVYINPAISWDLNVQDTLGYYTPKVNERDTITVWVSMPNGQQDTVTRDDTLTKIIYGSSDIVIHFITFPDDNVYNTGPFEIIAEAYSLSGATIGQMSLFVTSVFNGTSTYDTLPMVNISGNLWKTIIAQKTANSDIIYSIKLIDILGNQIVLRDRYYIHRPTYGVNGYVIIGTGTTAIGVSPLDMEEVISWSRQLYLGNEFAPGAPGGTITKFAWYYSGVLPFSSYVIHSNHYCYFQVVDDVTITPNSYVDPVTDGASLVWTGTLNPTTTGWYEFELNQPFNLPPGKNLLIYWNNDGNRNRYDMVGATWNHTNTGANLTAYAADFSGRNKTFFNISTYRPNARFYIVGENNSDSVALVSIDIGNTVFVSPGNTIPIVVTIKNQGIDQLDSISVFYSINGSIQVGKNIYFKPALPWDFTVQDTIGYYNPKINGWDTITVWISRPNGRPDPVTDNDTVTKIIYGNTDIAMTFINSPTDTVYNTGAFEVTAEIVSRSGATLGQVSLFVATTFEGVTSYDTLEMVNTSDNLWKTTIPQKVFGSDVSYVIKLTDILGNYVEIEDSYSIQRSSGGGITGYVTIGTGTTTDWYTPVNVYYEYGFSRQLYLGTEFSPDAQGGTITKLAWDYAIGTSWAFTNQSCYFQAVDDAAITSSAYIDPGTNGSTLVWQGTLSASEMGWLEISLDQPFFLPPGKNLLIYWEQKSGNWVNSFLWNHTTTFFNSTARGYSSSSFLAATTSNLSLNTARPNARFYLMGGNQDSNSVALTSINSPEDAKGILANGTPVPVQISIQNKGLHNLDSCVIKWSLNGQVQPDFIIYRGTLPEDFTDTITIGSHIPTVGKWDTITVWVSMPNGVMDSTNYDDTLMITSFGCASLSGTVTVGNGGSFISINDALNSIHLCGVSGDITLALKGIFRENIDLTGLSDYMRGYSLTITSADNHPDSAIIRPPLGTGITLSNMRNLTLKAITIDAAISGINAIQFKGACTNIVVRDCKLLSDSTTKSSSCNLVYKEYGTGIVDSIFFINNLLDGGYFGFYLFGGIGAGQYGSHIVFDSNTLSNQYNGGIYTEYVDFKSCSFNTILSRTTNEGTNWIALSLNSTNGPVISNRIMQRSTAITYPYGIYFQYYNYYPTAQVQGRGLIANNEIILNTTSTYSGIYAFYSKAEILHNSIYISGSGSARGIYIYNGITNDMAIKNNNIVLTSSTAHPIYFSATGGNLNLCNINYNNLYAPTYVGYYGGNITTMVAWQQATGKDLHSVNIFPYFINPLNNLKLNSGKQFLCDKVPLVNDDIENISRSNVTTMGCYEILKNVDAMLIEITGLRNGNILSQSDSIKVIVQNTGLTPLTSVNLEWSVNGTSQIVGGINYSVSLSIGESDTITLGQITYFPAGNMNTKVWINHINGSITGNDTLNTSIFICTGSYSGLLTVGTNANNDFQTIEQAYDALNLCGVGGDITLALEPGIYVRNWDISNNATLMSNYTMTITSTTNNANDVIIRPASGVGILLNNTRNLILKAITVDAATSGTNAIQFTGATCTNIMVRDCKLLANSMLTSTSYNSVYKASNTGIVDSIFFINNTLDGGYYGFYFYGSASISAYGTNVIFDSNTVSNQYYAGTFTSNVDFISCSYNTILSKTTGTVSNWYGLHMYFSNGHAVGNRIIQRNTGITRPYGIISQYHNSYSTGTVQGKGLIANNEIIILSATDDSYGIYAEYSKSEIIHNSIYISGIGAARGIQIQNSTDNDIVIKNNNIVLTSSTAYPIHFSTTGNLNLYDIDYNNLYAPTNVGYYGGNITTIAAWQQQITTDQHSVKVFPEFINALNSLELAIYNNTLSCPAAGILTDIRGLGRPNITTMGAYIQPPIGQDLAVIQTSPWNREIINNQTIQVNVDLFNTGLAPVDSASFGWSINGIEQQPSVSWTATPSLNSFEQQNVSIGTFQASGTDTFNIVVWIKNINGQQDTVNNNDTVWATTVIHPLAEFMATAVDTIYAPDFDVNAKIRTMSGAPVTLPVLHLETIVNGSSFLYDSIPMVLQDNIWQANIPQQYYNSKVIYSLTVSDSIGNIVTLKDSVYIQLTDLDKSDTAIIGTGTLSG